MRQYRCGERCSADRCQCRRAALFIGIGPSSVHYRAHLSSTIAMLCFAQSRPSGSAPSPSHMCIEYALHHTLRSILTTGSTAEYHLRVHLMRLARFASRATLRADHRRYSETLRCLAALVHVSGHCWFGSLGNAPSGTRGCRLVGDSRDRRRAARLLPRRPRAVSQPPLR
jgi:hypothetical protein